MCGRLPDLTDSIREYAKGFDVGALSCERAAEVVSYCSTIESCVGAVKMLAAARLAEGGSWKREGFRSAPEQLAAATGSTTGAARAVLDTGRRLNGQPEVAGAARAGELSPSQAALVANGVEADPSKTGELLDKARSCSVSELKDEVARIKAAASDPDKRRQAIHAGRGLRSWTDIEGIWRLAGQGLPDDGARWNQVIATIRRALIASRRERGLSGETFEALDYDSVKTLIDILLGNNSELSLADLYQHGLIPGLDEIIDLLHDLDDPPDDAHPDAGAEDSPIPSDDEDGLAPSLFDDATAADGATEPDRPPVDPPQAGGQPPASPKKRKRKGRRRGALTTQIHLRIDLDALLRGVPIDGELCEIVGYGSVPVSVVEELLANGNTFIVAALTKAKAIVGVHHFGRQPTAHQKSALNFLYPSCAAQGCNTKAFLQNDHREDWAKTHYTVYDLMDRLCTHHHRLKTTQNWALVEGTGKRAFVAPDDPRHPRNRGPTTHSTSAA